MKLAIVYNSLPESFDLPVVERILKRMRKTINSHQYLTTLHKQGMIRKVRYNQYAKVC